MSATAASAATTPIRAAAAGLDVADRCDRCGSPAKVRVQFATGGELLFCGHHARAHEGRLREVAISLRSVG